MINDKTAKRAKSLNLTVEDLGADDGTARFKGMWRMGKTDHAMFAPTVPLLLEDVASRQEMFGAYRSFKVEQHDDDQVTITIKGHDGFSVRARPSQAFKQAKKYWQEARSELSEEQEDQDPEDQPDDEEEDRSGSVVGEKFRLRYAEAGHATHCGDWLAVALINLTVNKAGTNIEMVDAIAAANGIDLSKYNRTNKGWQGRLRMTLRNMLARKVWLAGGALTIPNSDALQAPVEWMSAQKFKGARSPTPAEQAPAPVIKKVAVSAKVKQK